MIEKTYLQKLEEDYLRIETENKRYREAMKKIRKLTETDAGTEEEVFIIADNILLEGESNEAN